MSRIGKTPIVVPAEVTLTIEEQKVTVKGKLGELNYTVDKHIKIERNENEITVSPLNDNRKTRAMWATSRSLINNMIIGVNEGFKKELELRGVGYRAQLQGNTINLQLGLSHDVKVPVLDGLKVEVPSQTEIIITGFNKQQVGQFAANIRDLRPPEPYKGKGIRYKGEYVLMKEGKKK